MFHAILRNAGIHPRQFLTALRGWRRYVRERAAFKEADLVNTWPWGREIPILTEWEQNSGSLGAYFFQDQLVARWIYEEKPARHLDIGSRLDGFIANLSVFREVEVIDIRPQPQMVRNVTFHQLDLMKELPLEWVECTDSLSCLHTLEHFGLGRYGDTIDPEGHLKGLAQMKRMVKPGGLFCLSTPIGPQRVEFNAHRIFAAKTLVSWFDDGWQIERCAIIDDNNQMHDDVEVKALRTYAGNMGLGIVCAKRLR